MELTRKEARIGILYGETTPKEYLEMFDHPWKLSFLHDRWPRYTYTTQNGFVATCQHFVSEGIVYIRTVYSTNSSHAPMEPVFGELSIPPDEVQIRELDFTVSTNPLNESSEEESPRLQSHCLGPHGHSVIIYENGYKPKFSKPMADKGDEVVALVCAVFIGGEMCRFEADGNEFGEWYTVIPRSTDDLIVLPLKPVEITMAYRLQLMPESPEWKECLISGADFLRMDTELAAEDFGHVQFSQDNHLDFIFRRNLEHILSVCSVPVSIPASKKAPSTKDGDDQNATTTSHGQTRKATTTSDGKGQKAIALTCGDWAGHRLVTSAGL